MKNRHFSRDFSETFQHPNFEKSDTERHFSNPLIGFEMSVSRKCRDSSSHNLKSLPPSVRTKQLTDSTLGKMFGGRRTEYEMKLTSNDKVWCPAEHPEYLCVLKPNQNPPKSAELLLVEQVILLRRLVKEANEGEIRNANRMLDNLPEENWINLPLKQFNDPRTANVLLVMPAEINGLLAEWKAGMEEAVKLPPMSEKEATEEAESLSLESFLSKLL